MAPTGEQVGQGQYLDKGKPRPEILQEIISRIVAVANPYQLILFGSAARGEMDAESDVDILVVLGDPTHRRALAGRIYRHLHGLGVPVDVVVATQDDIRQFGQKNGTVLLPALREGIVIYETRSH
jgi:predicted nucleotidyltransferase